MTIRYCFFKMTAKELVKSPCTSQGCLHKSSNLNNGLFHPSLLVN